MPFAFSVLGSTTFGQEFFKPVVTPVTTQPLIVPIDNNYGSPTLTRWEYVYPPVFAQLDVATYFIMSGSEPISTTASLMMIFTAPDGTVSSTHQVEVGKDDLAQSTGRYIGGTFAIGFVPAGFIDQPGVWQIELVVDLVKLSAIGHFVVQGTGPVPVPPPTFPVWTDISANVPSGDASSLEFCVCDQSGSKLFAGAQFFSANGGYTSSDQGVTWAATGLPRLANAYTGASSSNGQVLATASPGQANNFSITSNRGSTWSSFAPPFNSGLIEFIAMSGDGQKILLGDGQFPGTAKASFSLNQGSTWTQVTGVPSTTNLASWTVGAISRDGSHFYVGGVLGDTIPAFLVVSTNNGVSWTDITPLGPNGINPDFGSVCCSADGTVVYVLDANTHDLYVSTNSGGAWTHIVNPFGGAFNNNSACSDDGTIALFATGNDTIWLSKNTGATWTEQKIGGVPIDASWIAVSGDGTKAIASGDGFLYAISLL